MAETRQTETASGRPSNLIRLTDLSDTELDSVLRRALEEKHTGLGNAPGPLAGRSIGLLFFRGSLRTRVSLEAAMHQLGGHTIQLSAQSDAWDLEEREGSVMDGRAPEHVKDAARVLSSYVDALAIRPTPTGKSWDVDRRDAQIAAWARHATVPVINMESSLWHPLQALSDLATLRETFGELRGKRLNLTWVHSSKPATPAVAHSVLHAALRAGMNLRLSYPQGFELDGAVTDEARELAAGSQAEFEIGHDFAAGFEGADVVYARSWSAIETYGNPTLAASRRSRAKDWRIDEDAFAHGAAQAKLMHAMPVRRNLEVTDEVLDGPRSLIQLQAENRLHSQKALLAQLLS